jgi:tRNA threonylcarbamoyladenosine biosynthesis protein TsaE
MPDNHLQITTRSASQTRKLGQSLGAGIDHPVVIALTGDLGSGKTAFVQGLAKGLDVPEQYYITSPTFTLINEYPGRLQLFHVDLYRIEYERELEEIGLDEILYQEAVVAIEWAEKLSSGTLSDYLQFRLTITGDETRLIEIIACGHQAGNLLKALEL